MSLGFARDSIADLQNLASLSVDDDPKYTKPPGSNSLPDDDRDEFCVGFDIDEVQPDLHILNSPIENSEKEGSKSEDAALNMKVGLGMGMTRSTSYRDLVKDPSTADNISNSTSSSSLSSTPHLGKNRENKKQKQTENNANVYSGFQYTDYDTDYYADPYAAAHQRNSRQHKKKNKNVLSCIFPFLGDPLEDSDSDLSETSHEDNNDHDPLKTNTSTSRGERKLSNDTKKSPQRVHPSSTLKFTSSTSTGATATSTIDASLPTPVSAPPSSPKAVATTTPKVNTSPTPAANVPEPLKGILKRSIINTQPDTKQSSTRNIHSIKHEKEITGSSRRSILPTYESSAFGPNTRNQSEPDDPNNKLLISKKKKRLTFSTMARVMPVMARSDMSFYLKSIIWWQRNDYDDFKKTGRIIAKAMLQGGSEIWLETSNAWGKKQVNKSSSPSTPQKVINNHRDTPEHISAVRRYNNTKTQTNGTQYTEEKKQDSGDDGNKWWCKFGHSRRGLEHVVTIKEGRQRQRLVNASIAAVVDEQRRQRISRRDHKKIASISMQYTSWAKDLALAAGAADAETVRSNFDSNAKGRLAYLRSKLLSRGTPVEGETTANFILSANSAFSAEMLDSNTHSSTMKKRKQQQQQQAQQLHNDIAHKAAGFQFQETKEA